MPDAIGPNPHAPHRTGTTNNTVNFSGITLVRIQIHHAMMYLS
jgi:hypothetical protein